MRKIFTSMLLMLTLGVSTSLAEQKVVKSWTFTGNSGDVALTTDASTSLTEVKNVICYKVTAPTNCAGVYVQGSWKCYKNTNGLRNVDGGGRMLIVPDLKSGDVITVATNNTDYISGSKYEGVATADKDSIVYTMGADGNFYFYLQKTKAPDYPALYTITVTREVQAGTCEDPKGSITGTNGTSRIFTLSCETADAEIYYSENELTSATGGTKYENEVTTSAEKIWAYAKTNDATSSVVSFDTFAGTVVALNVPTISTSFVQNGDVYNPVYSFSSDQSTVLGKPAVTYTYEIGGVEGEGTSYTAATTGTLVVTAKADGYTSSTAEISISQVDFTKAFNYDFSTFTSHSEVTVGSSRAINSVGCQAYELASDAVDGLTINTNLAWAVSKDKAYCLYARAAAGSVVYNGAFPENAVISYTDAFGNRLSSTTNTISMAIYETVATMDVYVPATTTPENPTRETATGKFGTICLPYAFTVEGAVVYSATLSSDKSALELTEVPSPEAGKAYLYQATADGSKTFNLSGDAVSAPVANGALVGVFTDTEITSGYVLQTQGGVQQFYYVDSTTPITVPANKAYVAPVAGAKSLSFRFAGEETTGINALNALVSGNAKIYDINGRQLKSLQKGVNIVNGTKVVVK